MILGIIILIFGFGVEGMDKERESILFFGIITIGDNFVLIGIFLKLKLVFEIGSKI